MATNPMQKKARNAFLLGAVVMLIISLVIGALIYLLAFKEEPVEDTRGAEVLVFVLTQPVKSGHTITADMLKQVTLYTSVIPSNYIDGSMFYMFEIQTEEGNPVYPKVSENGEERLYMLAGEDEIRVQKDEYGGYYIEVAGEQRTVKMVNAPIVAKVDLTENTILTASTITQGNAAVTNDLRLVEYNMITLPTTLDVGDFIDIRMTFPNGQDFIVLSKKEIISVEGDTIGLNLTELEILTMNCAVVDGYIVTASNIYAVNYVDAGMQNAAIPTYPVNEHTENLIRADRNIVAAAQNQFANRKIENLRESYINPYVLDEYGQSAINNIETGITEQVTKAKEARDKYLSELSGYSEY